MERKAANGTWVSGSALSTANPTDRPSCSQALEYWRRSPHAEPLDVMPDPTDPVPPPIRIARVRTSARPSCAGPWSLGAAWAVVGLRGSSAYRAPPCHSTSSLEHSQAGCSLLCRSTADQAVHPSAGRSGNRRDLVSTPTATGRPSSPTCPGDHRASQVPTSGCNPPPRASEGRRPTRACSARRGS